MKWLVPVTFIVFLSACTDSTNETTTTNERKDSVIPVEDHVLSKEVAGCYMRVIERDTIVAHLFQNGNAVTGKLTFDNYQRDGSTGTVTGNIEGDIVKLIYEFQSEGMHSVSQVNFKHAHDGLIRGIGEIAVTGDSSYYKNENSIRYEESEKLNKVDCDQVPAKYRHQ